MSEELISRVNCSDQQQRIFLLQSAMPAVEKRQNVGVAVLVKLQGNAQYKEFSLVSCSKKSQSLAMQVP